MRKKIYPFLSNLFESTIVQWDTKNGLFFYFFFFFAGLHNMSMGVSNVVLYLLLKPLT